MKQIRKRLTYANVMSSVAVFLLLGGATAFAASHLGKNSVGAKQLKKNAVTGPKVKDGAITATKIADGSIISAKLADGSVITGKIVNAAVTTEKVADKAITTGKVADKAITTGQLGDAAVTTEKLAPSSVNSQKIADGQVRAADLGTITEVSKTSASIAAGANGSVTATCNAGEQLISGGNDGFFELFVVASRQSGNGWAVFVHNTSGGSLTVTAHAYCLAS